LGMQPMSSMQTSLLPGVTPGWNDPPPLGNSSSGSRLNRYRRVVDPSLTAAGGSPAPYAASPLQGMPMGMANGMASPQSMQPVQHMQPVQQQYYAQPGYSMPGSNSVAPTGGFGTTPQEQQQQQLHMQQQYPQQPHQPPPSAIPPPSHFSHSPSISVPPAGPIPMSPYQQPGGGQVVNITHHTQYDSGMYNMHGLNQAAQMQHAHGDGQMDLYSNQPSSHSSPHQMNYMGAADPNLMLFTPPNTVPGEDDSFIDSLNYKPPMKAPGDVSLNGSKLVEFLVKGAVKLPQAKSHGVQLGLKPLKGEIGEMSKDDPFIKKFNYVVDAVDREAYDDAHRHLEEMLVSFPDQTRVPEGGQQERKWVGAVKLLIKELPLRHATSRNH
ncbi:hypothetical protein PRIPAC_94356, partial [Pristionchus pacificus]